MLSKPDIAAIAIHGRAAHTIHDKLHAPAAAVYVKHRRELKASVAHLIFCQPVALCQAIRFGLHSATFTLASVLRSFQITHVVTRLLSASHMLLT